MTKLQKRAKPNMYLPVALRAGVPSASPPSPNASIPLSPFQKTHRRGASTPRTPQTQWPLIATSSPPSMAYPNSPHHDSTKCGDNCTRCGKKKLIQLNSPPTTNIPKTAAPLRPIPQAHMRSYSDGVLTRPGPKRVSITVPTALTPGKPPCCQKCGRQKRPASLPVSSRQAQVQMPSSDQRKPIPSQNYSVLRTNLSGTTTSTPHPNRAPSRSPSPTSPDHVYPGNTSTNEEHVISPLSPRQKVSFALPSKSSSGASYMPYSPLSQSDNETAELGTGRLINLISNAIRETSPPQSRTGAYALKHTTLHSRSTSVEAVVGLGLSLSDSAEVSSDEDTRRARLKHFRSPVDAKTPFEPVELDSVPIGDTTADILSGYDDEKDFAASRVSILPLTEAHRGEAESNEWAEYGYDWTDAIGVPVIRLPSVREGISRFKSLRGGGTGRGRRSSVRGRFGSLRGNASGIQQEQQAVWYGGLTRGASGRGYQPLESSVEVGVY